MTIVYFDGASKGSPGESAIGIFINHHSNIFTINQKVGKMTSHEAEWKAFNMALSFCLEKNFLDVLIHTDSQIIVDAVEKKFVKNQLFKAELEDALSKIKHFQQFFLKWVPSKENKADRLAREVLHRHT